MKAGIFFTGSGPILILTSFESLSNQLLIDKLTAKGIKKSIAYEIPDDAVRQKYGEHYEIIMNELHQEDDLRVLDYDGHQVFNNFSFANLGEPSYHETT
jgi:hypothetical protein